MVRPTSGGRSAYGLLVAVLLTVALLGWDRLARPDRRSSAAGEGTSAAPAPPRSSRALPSRPVAVPPTAGSPTAVPPTAGPPTTVPTAGSGRLAVVPGTGTVRGRGPLWRYRVMIEVGLPESPAAFAAEVERTLADPRGWGGEGRLSFQRVETGRADLTIVLASPSTTDRLCRPLITAGIYSCFTRGRSVLNAWRWRTGAPTYAGALASYRQYVVLHEVGHALGHGHVSCPGPGRLAPTMMQQTRGVGACRPNPWPFPGED